MVAIFPGNASVGKDSDGKWDPQRSEVCAPSAPDLTERYRIFPSPQRVLGQQGRQAPASACPVVSLASVRVVLGIRAEVERLQAGLQTHLDVAQAGTPAPYQKADFILDQVCHGGKNRHHATPRTEPALPCSICWSYTTRRI